MSSWLHLAFMPRDGKGAQPGHAHSPQCLKVPDPQDLICCSHSVCPDTLHPLTTHLFNLPHRIGVSFQDPKFPSPIAAAILLLMVLLGALGKSSPESSWVTSSDQGFLKRALPAFWVAACYLHWVLVGTMQDCVKLVNSLLHEILMVPQRIWAPSIITCFGCAAFLQIIPKQFDITSTLCGVIHSTRFLKASGFSLVHCIN